MERSDVYYVIIPVYQQMAWERWSARLGRTKGDAKPRAGPLSPTLTMPVTCVGGSS